MTALQCRSNNNVCCCLLCHLHYQQFISLPILSRQILPCVLKCSCIFAIFELGAASTFNFYWRGRKQLYLQYLQILPSIHRHFLWVFFFPISLSPSPVQQGSSCVCLSFLDEKDTRNENVFGAARSHATVYFTSYSFMETTWTVDTTASRKKL